jgi:hypothetical protein
MTGVRVAALRSVPVLVLAVLTSACADAGSTGPETGGPDPVTHTLTVDASGSWAYAAFQGGAAALVSVADPATSTVWDLGFQKTAVLANGGTAGPGGVVAHCVCQNADATDAEIQAMDPAAEGAEFDEVTAAQIPTSEDAWSATAFADHPWSRYNLAGNHQIWPTYDVYLVRSGSEVYKVQIVSYYGPAGETRQITFRYALLAR